MLLFLLRNCRLRFPVLMTLLLFMGMLPNQGFGQDPPPAATDAVSGAGNVTGPSEGGNGTASGRSSGTEMKEIKCYSCSHRPKYNEDPDCAAPNLEKLKDKTTTCKGVCTKLADKGGAVSRGCSEFTQKLYGCYKSAYGSCFDPADLSGNQIMEKENKVAECSGLEYKNKAIYFGRSGEEIKIYPGWCFCDSELCNPADHSSPNKKLVFAISMMTTVYLAVFKFN